jgi:hypothetical protein
LWQDLRGKCDELSSLVLRAGDPEDAAAYVLSYLPKHLEYLLELLCGRRRVWAQDPVGALSQPTHRNGKHNADHA